MMLRCFQSNRLATVGSGLEERSPSSRPSPPRRGRSTTPHLEYSTGLRSLPVPLGFTIHHSQDKNAPTTQKGDGCFSLFPGERAGVRADFPVASTLNSFHQTQRRTK